MSFQLHPHTVRSAESLKNPQNINGIEFDGTKPIKNYTICYSPTDVDNKQAEIDGFKLTEGAIVTVYFPNGNTGSNPTLNINGSGDKPIQWGGQPLIEGAIKADHTYTLAYDGKAWQIISGYTDTPEVRTLINNLGDTLTNVINNNYTTLDTKIDRIKVETDTTISNNYTTLDTKIDRIKVETDTTINNNYNTLNQKIDNTSTTINHRIDGLQTDLNNKIDSTKDELSKEIDKAGTLSIINTNSNTYINEGFNGQVICVYASSTVTVPRITQNGFHVYIKNLSGGDITIAPAGCYIDGSNYSFTISRTMTVLLISDGANYIAMDTSAKFQ